MGKYQPSLTELKRAARKALKEEFNSKAKKYLNRLEKLKGLPAGNDDPYADFYTVREQRAFCKRQISHIKNYIYQGH